jgi:hypothetical protein
MKIEHVPLTPTDQMFQGPPSLYSPGPAPAPRPVPPRIGAAIRACQARERAACDPTHFDTAQIIAAQFGLKAVQLYGAWCVATAFELDVGRD